MVEYLQRHGMQFDCFIAVITKPCNGPKKSTGEKKSIFNVEIIVELSSLSDNVAFIPE